MELVQHAWGLVATAVGVGLVLALIEGLVKGLRRGGACSAGGAAAGVAEAARAWGSYAGVGVAVTLLGLALLGRDGKMLTYAALALATGGLLAWRTRP